MKCLILIPARMGATRLPGKPLKDIHGLPMITHVQRRAKASACGPVYVAAGDQVIVDAVMSHGGQAVLTDPDLPSGSDRVRAAADMIDPDVAYDVIVNVQGDMPTLDPGLIESVVATLDAGADIATAAVETIDAAEIADSNTVKVVISAEGRALYFSRSAIPHGAGPVFHHLGIYAYKRAALNRFCALPPSHLEQREKLEQLRALEDGMRIDVAVVSVAPKGVDTQADLDWAREYLKGQT